MKRLLSILLVITILFVTGCKSKQPAEYKNFSIEKIADGVWAVINNDKGGHAICNAGIVDMGDSVIVFDTFINPDAAAELKKAAEDLTGHEVNHVIDSHFHDDHVRGNQVFVPGATIISTERTKKEMAISEPAEQDWAKKNISAQLDKAKQSLEKAVGKEKEEATMWIGYYEAISQSLSQLKTYLPDITFNDTMMLHGSKRNAQLVEIKNGHTVSDAILILPGDGIVFMGDVLFKERHPWFGDGDPESNKNILTRLMNDASLTKFVPGHGPVSNKDDLQKMINYINDLQQMAVGAAANKEADSIFVKRPIPAAYEDWWFSRFYEDNLSTVYSKAKSK